MGREREARHFLILGSVGGGKTQTMLHLIDEALVRGDGVLVLDAKGDMMGGLPAQGDPLLVAPHDRRSLVWDVATDCSIKQDARELAARFIPPSSDPMWSQAAQEIFVACIVHLQATRNKDWGWADLERVVTADIDQLTTFARDHNPNALRLFAQPDSKTTLSILTTFQTHMRIVSVLAEAWPDPSAPRFSIRAWLHNPTPYRPLILQHDPGYPELSRIWIGSMLGLLASAVGSPTLTESRKRRAWLFSAGWDMTFSAPKSVSVLWALSADHDRQAIEQAHRSAVLAATARLEGTAGWARRGRGGATREQTAGLLMAQFDHHTSRESDPQLHTHAFIFNLAPRRDGSWGAILSRELYKAQKAAGATYRHALASELERHGILLERQKDTSRVAAIPRDVERVFSKRRQAIEEAARIHGYSTPKGMELATLRTRRPKRDARLSDLIKHWHAEAKTLRFELGQSRQQLRATARSDRRAHPTPLAGRHNTPSPSASAPSAVAAAATNADQQHAAQLGSRLGQAIRALDQPAGMSGVRIKLRYREREQE
jgi:conjugative relaxase-like TrwC/TraI family protein